MVIFTSTVRAGCGGGRKRVVEGQAGGMGVRCRLSLWQHYVHACCGGRQRERGKEVGGKLTVWVVVRACMLSQW